MRSRLRIFLLLAVLLFIVHFIVTAYAAEWLTKTLNGDPPIEQRFAPSYAVAVSTLPLLRMRVVNDAVFAIIVAFVVAFLPWRAIVAVVIIVPLLLLGGMFGTALWLEHRTASIWSELQPRPTGPPIRGEVQTSLGDEPITALADYLGKRIERDGPAVDPPPQEVDWFLVAHRAQIDPLRHALPATRDPLQLFRIQKVLLADALQTRAWDEVEAAQRIADKMLREPDHNHALYAIASYDNQLGVIRKLDAPAGFVLPSFDPHQKLIDAIHARAAWLDTVRAPWYTQPYARLCIAESAYAAASQARVIRDFRGRGTEAPPEANAGPRVPFNPTGVFEGGERYASRANKLVIDRQRTAVSLAARKRS